MSNLVNANYYANYDDYNGCDDVPCVVDLDKMEVVSFGPANACRWYEDAVLMCVEENIQLETGEMFEAIKFDEYNDAVDGGYDDDYDRENIILFDADDLADACSMFAVESEADASEGFYFETCIVDGSPTCVSNTSTVAMDVHDAAEHMKRAVRTMTRSNERVTQYNIEKWPGFYDEYLSKATEMLTVLENYQSELADLEQKIRMMG